MKFTPHPLEGMYSCQPWSTGLIWILGLLSIMSETKNKQLWPGRSLSPSQIKLQTYSKEHLVVVGSQDVQVCYENQKVTLPLVIVRGNGPTLFGTNWLRVIKLNWSKIYYLQSTRSAWEARSSVQRRPWDIHRTSCHDRSGP